MKGKATIGDVAVMRTESIEEEQPLVEKPVEVKKDVIAECATFSGTKIRFIEGIAKNGNSYEQTQKITKNRKTGKEEFSSLCLFENEMEGMNCMALAKYYKGKYQYYLKKAKVQWEEMEELQNE